MIAVLPPPACCNRTRARKMTASNSASSDSTAVMTGTSSPSRTLRGARRPGVAACITLSANSMICAGIRYPTDNPTMRGVLRDGRCSSTSFQSFGARGPVAWAMSPTTVIEPLRERRVTMRNCIGVRSCTSSTTMCPNVRISSVSSTLPLLRGRGPSKNRASSRRAASALLQRTSSNDSDRSRYKAK